MTLYELAEYIQTTKSRQPYLIAIEGMIGSGKSYEAKKLLELLQGESMLLSTDLFVSVPRSEWTQRLLTDELDLREWYDLDKIKETLNQIRRKDSFTVSGLYNLSNGKFDDKVAIDSGDYDFMILEGLFSCSEYLQDLIDLSVFIDVPKEIALQRAHDRDQSVRHLDQQGWLQKKDIFYDHYLPYLENHKQRAHVILNPD